MSGGNDKALRPIIGIQNRTPQEVFDMMCSRFRAVIPAREEAARNKALEEAADWLDNTDRGWCANEAADAIRALKELTDE